MQKHHAWHIHGTSGRHLRLFLHNRQGRGAQTWQQTVFAFSHDLSLPAFDLKPENFMDRLRDAFNHKDIDFDSHPEFSRRYFLRSPRQERTKELFTPELLTYLEGL